MPALPRRRGSSAAEAAQTRQRRGNELLSPRPNSGLAGLAGPGSGPRSTDSTTPDRQAAYDRLMAMVGVETVVETTILPFLSRLGDWLRSSGAPCMAPRRASPASVLADAGARAAARRLGLAGPSPRALLSLPVRRAPRPRPDHPQAGGARIVAGASSIPWFRRARSTRWQPRLESNRAERRRRLLAGWRASPWKQSPPPRSRRWPPHRPVAAGRPRRGRRAGRAVGGSSPDRKPGRRRRGHNRVVASLDPSSSTSTSSKG